MTESREPFDHRPDPVLGAALRAALHPAAEQRVFVTGVLDGFDAARAPFWEVLAAWAPRGLAAAVAAGLVAGFLVGRALQAPATLDDALVVAAGESAIPAAALLIDQRPPDAGVVLASLVER
ncbi:MAG: hypothetical protein ACREL9_11605 [Gemmatimonadales bacterium]